MNIPDWVPSPVVDTLHEQEALFEKQTKPKGSNSTFIYESASSRLEAIRSLVYSQDPRMENVWSKLDGLKPCIPSIPYLANSTMFALSVSNAAVCGLNPGQKMTPAELNKWEKDIVGTTEKLISLIRGTEVDDFHHREYSSILMENGREIAGGGTPAVVATPERDLFSDTLSAFIDLVPSLINHNSLGRERVYIKAPNDALAPRAFFVVSLSDACKEAFGDPLTTVVEIVASAVFPDNPIEERAVRRNVAESRNYRGNSER